MPFIYVYSPSDFVGGLPNEQGAAAAGSGPFTLTLVDGATPTLIEVSDDDLVFDEVDSGQTLASTVTIDGDTFNGGTTINTAYDLIDSSSGHKVTSFHFGGNGYQQGAVDGLISTEPLEAGESYTFDTERTSHQKANSYSDYVACFVAGTRVATEAGMRPVEALVPGDLVLTQDAGLQPLRSVVSRRVSAEEMRENPKLRPVRLTPGALGQGLPTAQVCVSPQHRFLLKSPVAERMFGIDEVLIAAKKLAVLPGIEVVAEAEAVTYFHLILDRHEILFAEGAPTESFYSAPGALAALTAEARDELRALFPELLETGGVPQAIRPIPDPKRQSRIVSRHLWNKKPVLSRVPCHPVA